MNSMLLSSCSSLYTHFLDVGNFWKNFSLSLPISIIFHLLKVIFCFQFHSIVGRQLLKFEIENLNPVTSGCFISCILQKHVNIWEKIHQFRKEK